MATPNVGEPGRPRVCCVLKGFEMLSTIEIVLLAELEVRIAPVWGLMAREVGLMPTLTELPPPVSGLNCTMVFVPLELAKTTPVGGLETRPEAQVVLVVF